jgi:hypothetical protein
VWRVVAMLVRRNEELYNNPPVPCHLRDVEEWYEKSIDLRKDILTLEEQILPRSIQLDIANSKPNLIVGFAYLGGGQTKWYADTGEPEGLIRRLCQVRRVVAGTIVVDDLTAQIEGYLNTEISTWRYE